MEPVLQVEYAVGADIAELVLEADGADIERVTRLDGPVGRSGSSWRRASMTCGWSAWTPTPARSPPIRSASASLAPNPG